MLGGGLTGSIRKAQELIAELVSCFPLPWRFFSYVALELVLAGGTQVTVEVFIVSEEVQ